MKLEFPRTVPDEYLRAIGCVVNEWTFLETLVDNSLSMITELKHSDSLVLLTHLQSETKLNSIRNIIHQKVTDIELINEWENMLSEIKRYRGKRNLIVHSNWIFQTTLPKGETKIEVNELLKHPTSIVGTHIHAKGKETKSKNIHVTSETIDKLAFDIRELQNKLIALNEKTSKECKFITSLDHASVQSITVDI